MTMSERDEFEAFCKSRGWANPSASEWACWQAATARERERVATWLNAEGSEYADALAAAIRKGEVVSADVLTLNCVTRLDLPPDRMLQAAVGKLESGAIVGYTKEGEIYAASSYADGGDLLWLLEACKVMLLQAGKIIPSADP